MEQDPNRNNTEAVTDIEDGNPLVLEPDYNLVWDDHDSAIGSDMSILSSTGSLMSGITRELEENGRLYHGYKSGRYALPLDDTELERQDFQYHLCLATFDHKLSFAPLQNCLRVLDIGCGTGIWAMDFAEAHPEMQVTGVDLAPKQPQFSPANVQWEIDDLEEEWTFSYKFDYIHSVMMTGAFRDWPNFHRQAFEFLNPRGYLEIGDIDFPLACDDGTLPDDSPMKIWADTMYEAGKVSGYLLDTCGKAADFMHQAGFVDIVRIPLKWPVNRWPLDPKWSQVGAMTEANFVEGIEAMSLRLFTQYLGWSAEHVRELCEKTKADFHDTRKHAYFNIYVTYGMKP